MLKRLVLSLLCFLLLAACASQQPAFQPGSVVWPSPPMAPRLVLTTLVKTPQDAGIRKGFWGRIWSALVGEEDDAIRRPYGVYADCRQRLFVVDSGGRGIHLFDRRQQRYTFISGGKGVALVSPIGVTEDVAEHLYVTDSAAGTVYRCSLKNFELEPFIGGLKRPTGIAYNPWNRLIYVSDTTAAQIVAYNEAGREMFRFGGEGTGPGRFNHPTDVAIDPQGRVLVTDALNFRIQIFSKEGAFVRTFGDIGDSTGHFAKPKGVAADSEGHIYVCDALFDTVQVFNADGVLLMTFGDKGSRPGEFWMPSGIAIDKDDVVYVADTYNQRVQVFTYLWQAWTD